MHLRLPAAFLAAAVAWGTTGVATRAALNDGVPPIGLTAIRAVVATMVLVSIAVFTGRRIQRSGAVRRLGLVMAVFNLTLPFLLTTFALRYASAGFVGFIIALIPLATAVTAHYVLPDEPLHWRKVGTLTVALAGVALLLSSGDSGLAEGGRPLIAAALTGAAVISIGIAGVYAKRASGTYDSISLTAIQFGIGAVLAIPLAAVAEGIPRNISVWGWTLIVYLAVVGSVVPFLLFYWLLRHMSSTGVSTIAYVVPLVGLVAGIVLLDEELQFGIAIGGLLILTGVVLTNRTERSARRAIEPTSERAL